MGVIIVEDIKTLSAYGLEEDIYANGDLKGFIEADFLKPLPARTGFEENDDWLNLLDELDRLRPSIEAELEILKQEEAEKKLTEIQKKAIEVARDILNTEEFKDLELLEGLGRKIREPKLPPNGFDFVPPSIRIQPGKTGALPLKAFVPNVVPNNGLIRLSISDSSLVELITQSLIFKTSNADNDGVVTSHVLLKGKLKSTVPVILTAITGKLRTRANIRIAESGPTRDPIIGREKKGAGINYEERPFEEGPFRHSRYISRIIQINTLNPDYKREMKRTNEAKLAYAALMIGKETLVYNDQSEVADEYLEKMLTFYFSLKNRLSKIPEVIKRRSKEGPTLSV
jgi:hypothetical protein